MQTVTESEAIALHNAGHATQPFTSVAFVRGAPSWYDQAAERWRPLERYKLAGFGVYYRCAETGEAIVPPKHPDGSVDAPAIA